MNKFTILSVYLVTLGIFPSFLIKNRFLKLFVFLWNTFVLLFNLFWCFLEAHRLKQGLSVDYDKVEGGLLVNALLGVANIFTMSIVLGIRLWILIRDSQENLHKKDRNLFGKIHQSFQALSGKFVGRNFSHHVSALCLNELVLLIIIFLSAGRHCLFVYLQKVLFYSDYRPDPYIWTLEFEFRLRYSKALFLDLSPIDSLLLFCVFLLKLMEKHISYMNDRLDLNLIEMGRNESTNFSSSSDDETNNWTKYFINANVTRMSKQRAQSAFLQNLVLMEYKRFNILDVTEFYQFYGDLVKTWEELKPTISKLIFICFGLWMQNLCFNCFFSFTAAIDIGSLSLFAATFHFIVITNVVKYICTANAVHGMNCQAERLNNLLLRILASNSTVDENHSLSLKQEGQERATRGQIKVASKDVSIIAFLYDLNNKEKPLSLSGCHTFNRETVLSYNQYENVSIADFRYINDLSGSFDAVGNGTACEADDIQYFHHLECSRGVSSESDNIMDTCSISSASSEDSLLAATMRYVDNPDSNPEMVEVSTYQASSFKRRRTFAQRRKEVADIRTSHPTRIPLIIERYEDEKNLPALDKFKFLVPDGLSVADLMGIIRRRLQLSRNQTLFLLVNGSSIPGNTMTLGEVYAKHADEDGFLYIVFASHEVFGGGGMRNGT
ncbi:Microtubule-associated proteins 1A/1B light chain 3B [Orchesella cincta]|uniref:Microtubule-associated proteins 1A/1B light chain 3B n=1 Tax=Orchesella cincta TaxID=48709 RepID=A0A1D2MGP3_ORCCI|nr:Microtubule-associated proteins 1A/1B light chain 3B [Orchesella cincta]